MNEAAMLALGVLDPLKGEGLGLDGKESKLSMVGGERSGIYSVRDLLSGLKPCKPASQTER
jgi:hypothetical protein